MRLVKMFVFFWFRISAPITHAIVVKQSPAVEIYDGLAIFIVSHFVNSSPFSYSASSIKRRAFGIAFTAVMVVVTTPILPNTVNIVDALRLTNGLASISPTPLSVI